MYIPAHLHEAVGKSARAIDGRVAREATHLAERVRHELRLAFAHGSARVRVVDAEHETRALPRAPLALAGRRSRAEQQRQLSHHILRAAKRKSASGIARCTSTVL